MRCAQAKTIELTTAVSVERKLTTAKPVISDTTPRVGQTLTAAPGSWGPTGVTLTNQWKADGTAIPGATGRTLKLAAAQSRTAIAVAVTGTSVGYATATRTSKPTATVTALKLTATPRPKITATAKVGKKLTAKPGNWKLQDRAHLPVVREGRSDQWGDQVVLQAN